MRTSSSRLEQSVVAMREYFPNFSFRVLQDGVEKEGRWRGRVQPIQTTDNFEELLDDIATERPFYIQQGGGVFHHPSCRANHQNRNLVKRITKPFITFDLEVKYWGGMKHPKAFIISPSIPAHKKKHINYDDSICAYASFQDAWNWRRDTVVDFMGQILGWLIKWMVWNQTDIWIGDEVSHNTNYLLRSIGRNQQCWCGSGKKYKKCHQRSDESSTQFSVRA